MKKQVLYSSSDQYRLNALGLLFLAVYLLGTCFPDTWWTTHFLAFVSPNMRWSIVGLASTCFMVSLFQNKGLSLPAHVQSGSGVYGHIVILILTGIYGYLMFHFPIISDYYGDAYKVIPHLDQTVSNIPEGTSEALFSFGLSPWAGHSSVLAAVTYLAYYAELSYWEAFLWMDVFFGSLFVYAWLLFVRSYLRNTIWQVIMGLAGITAPFMLIFFGHIESYAPVFFLFLLMGICMLMYLKSKKSRYLWSLIPMLVLCLKVHPIALLFIPAMALLFIHRCQDQLPWASTVLSWQGVSKWMIVPIFTIGGILYFFVFEDYHDQRSLNDTAMEFDRLFLPLLSPEAPLDRYNLLSFNHIFDYFCQLFLWSPIALFVFSYLGLFRSSQIDWNDLSVLLTGLSLVLLGSLLFVINPLLSMQMDWDLLAIPAPIFLLIVLVLVRQHEEQEIGSRIFPISLALSLLTIPCFVIHGDEDSHSQRLESLGIRMYHTYYEWSSKVIQHALNMPKYDSRQDYEERKKSLLQTLKPYAIQEIDFEYARLLLTEGKYYVRQSPDYPRALAYLNEAATYFPQEKNLLLYQMEANFRSQQYQQAFDYSMELVRIQYPSEKKSITIALQCALEAEVYDEALHLARYYVQKWEDRPTFPEIIQRLETGKDVQTLKELFARQ